MCFADVGDCDVPPSLRPSFLGETTRLLRARHLTVGVAEVRRLPPGHPATLGGGGSGSGGVALGVFATASIPAFEPIALYGGELIDEDVCERRTRLPNGERNVYVFSLKAGDFSVDGGRKPRCFASHFNHFEGIMAAHNCDSLEVLCGGGCACHTGTFPEVTHPHIVIYSTQPIEAGTELCIDYGRSYWSTLGVDPTAPNDLMAQVLGANPSMRRAILEALLRQQSGDVPLVLQDAGEEDYLQTLSDADDPCAAFVDCVELIRQLSGRDLALSTGIAVGDAGLGFGFHLHNEISADVAFTAGLQSDIDRAALFLTRLRAKSMQSPPAAPEPVPRKRAKVPRTTEDAPGGAPGLQLLGAAGDMSVGGDDDAGCDHVGWFTCYGHRVTWVALKTAFDARLAIEPESTKGFWGRVADDVGVPNHSKATGRSGNIHRQYCDHFKHPFISAVGAKAGVV